MYLIKEDNTTIIDSYLLKNEDIDSLLEEIIKERKIKNYPVYRSIKEYKKEIIAHNRLYKMGIKKSHTKDVDLEEPIKKYKQFFYNIIGWYL